MSFADGMPHSDLPLPDPNFFNISRVQASGDLPRLAALRTLHGSRWLLDNAGMLTHVLPQAELTTNTDPYEGLEYTTMTVPIQGGSLVISSVNDGSLDVYRTIGRRVRGVSTDGLDMEGKNPIDFWSKGQKVLKLPAGKTLSSKKLGFVWDIANGAASSVNDITVELHRKLR